MTLVEVADWLRTQVSCPFWYIGKMASKKERCIGLYDTTGAPVRLAVGGVAATGYAVKAVSILVHWGRDPNAAELQAQAVHAAMFGVSNVMIGGKRVIMFRMVTPDPVNVGTDGEGIFEYVIEVHIYHER